MSTQPTAVLATAPATVPATEPTTAPATVPTAEQTPATETLDTLKGKYEKSVQAEKNLRARLKEAEAAEAELKRIREAEMSEADRLKQQLAELQTANAKATAEANRARAQVVASQTGFLPDAAALWLESQQLGDWSAEAIKAALASAPAWVKAPAVAGVTTPPASPPRGNNENTMTRAEFERLPATEQMRLALAKVNLTD